MAGLRSLVVVALLLGMMLPPSQLTAPGSSSRFIETCAGVGHAVGAVGLGGQMPCLHHSAARLLLRLRGGFIGGDGRHACGVQKHYSAGREPFSDMSVRELKRLLTQNGEANTSSSPFCTPGGVYASSSWYVPWHRCRSISQYKEAQ